MSEPRSLNTRYQRKNAVAKPVLIRPRCDANDLPGASYDKNLGYRTHPRRPQPLPLVGPVGRLEIDLRVLLALRELR